ncbi:MAG: hypothetical protein ABEJ69_03895 [Candidatus Nanohaloarchaea archaeon]
MSWYALDIIEEALNDTRELLFPFNWKTWGKIAIIAFFAGGVGSPSMPSSFPSSSSSTQNTYDYDTASQFTNSYHHMIPEMPMTGLATGAPQLSSAAWLLIGFLFLGVVFLFGFLGAVFSFVYYQSLLDEDVRIRKNFSRHFEKGVRLFGFRFGLTILMLGVLVLMLLGMFSAPLVGILMLFAVLPLLLVFGIFMGLTNQFIPLVMMESGKGVIASWKQFWPTLKQEWRQLAIYVVVRFFLQIGAGIITMLGAAAVGVVLLIPFGLLAVLFYTFAEAFVAIPLILGVIVFVVAFFYLVNGPVQTYFRYYAIRMYHALTV